MSFCSRKTFCVVSGASRGFGASVSSKCVDHLAPNSVIVLLARNAQQLASTKQTILDKRPDLKVFTWSVDMLQADADDLKKLFTDLFTQNPECSPSNFSQCLIVHNLGSLGNISISFTEQSNKKELNDYWTLNLTSLILLNSIFFSFFTKSQVPHRYAVQISSLCALKPFKYWGLYCGAKAARDMLFQVLSEEEDIRVFSYAPGPMRTDMFDEAVTLSGHPETKAQFQEIAKTCLLTCDESASKLANVLKNDVFVSGSHLDFYDLDDGGRLLADQ